MATKSSRRKPRRGIVLLVVISLLVLFMLILVTFAVVTGLYRDSSTAFAYRKELQVKFAENNAVLDDILSMILAEPASPSSALWGHSLLADMYGKSINGVISSPTVAEGGNSFVAFYGVGDAQQTFPNAAFSNSEDYYVGCVITMKDGPCAGLSSRITHYYPGDRPPWRTPTPATLSVDDPVQPGAAADPIALRMEAFENGLLPQTGNRFVINDKPFNGTGAGQPTTGEYANNRVSTISGVDYQWALLPHLAGWGSRTDAAAALAGGADEPWDTFDFHNIHLALAPSDPSSPPLIKPSYHDQALLNYWNTVVDRSDDGNVNGSASLFDAAHTGLLRQMMFRPLTADHPQFNGSNPAFDPTGASGNTWDVDNDRDNIPDSIWIDPGLPIATAPDGRKYKRLVAILIRDQDGKVNINAGGSVEFVTAAVPPPVGQLPQPPYPGQPGSPVPDPVPATPATEPLAGGPPAPSQFPRGLGVGPAEINPLSAFQLDGETAAVAASNYRRLFQGTSSNPLPPNPVGTSGVPGKYGLDLFFAPSGDRTSLPFNRRPGIWGPNGPGVYSNDPLSVVKTQGHGLDYAGTVFSNYATPSDVWGRGAIALDYSGQPYPYEQGQPTDWYKDTNPATISSPPGPIPPGSQVTAEINDNPYEINLIDGPQSYDTPYTVAELEALLRRNDADIDSLPPRLYNFLNVSTPGGLVRRINTLTTISSSNNAPRGALPYYMRNNPTNNMIWNNYGNPVSGTILDIAGARVNFENGLGTLTESVKQQIVKQIMPFEFYHGEMFNLNRPFGNGVDDNGNGVVDEPGETNNNAPGFALTEPAWTAGPLAIPPAALGGAYPLNDAQNHWWYAPPGAPPPVQAPGYPNGLVNSDPHLYARQLYARHLYCMLLLFCDPDYVTTVMPNPEGLDSRLLFCRRMAQFAINAVDNRDPDAIMTPFEYDVNPWDGWNVDGDLNTDETAWGLTAGMRGVVWGMEQQDLVLKETVSFHDKRTRDTAIDESMQGRSGTDTDLDQLRLPQGSTFIELYCPRARVANNPKLPVELYDPATGRLDVARMVPAGAAPYDQPHPVWQIAISNQMAGAATDTRPNTLITTQPDSFSLEPTLDPTGANAIRTNLFNSETITIERFVWFSNVEPAAATNMTDRTFINSLGWDVSLDPGSYLVIGPRTTTPLGALNDGDPMTYYDGPSPQAINLSAAAPGVAITNIDAGATSGAPGAQIRLAKAMVADIHAPRGGVNTIDGAATTWPTGAGARRVGLSVTEPLVQSGQYYTYPTNADDAYDDLASPMTMLLPDEPFDSRGGMPLEDADMLRTKTYARTHTFVLQRLANPTQPWHPVTNPYINLDWAENDTTVFTGDEDTARQIMKMMAMEDIDPEDPVARDPMMFRTRQRGNAYTAPVAAARDLGSGLLWYPQTVDPAVTNAATTTTTTTYFDYDLVHTLGFVNGIYSRDPASPATGDECTWAVTPGYKLNGGIASPLWNPAVGKRVATDLDVPPAYVGEPNVPFPWITWNNRPYANPMELLNVPTSSPQRIGQEFYCAFSGNVPDVFDASSAPAPTDVRGFAPSPPAQQGFYYHLLNFFLTTVYDPTGGGSIRPGTDFHRLFDFAETPSPYVATETWYGPAAVNANPGSLVTFRDPGTGYRAPFNRLSRGRDPGKININTIVDPLVWDAIVANYPEMQSTAAAGWQSGANLFVQMLWTRRGYPTGADTNNSADMFRGNANYPTLFANPFRPADAFDLQPLDLMKLNRPVDATLLRGNNIPLAADGASTPTPGPLPMFNYNGYDVGNLSDNTLYPNLSRATDRNSYFRHQPFTKLSNMLTTNSNTFAVWMTVGYFEVTPNTPNPPITAGGVDTGHPDGWQLGEEMLFDGSRRRPRAFFLIDRSIPAGFEPGKPLNTDRCVLQRRYIE